MKVLDYDSFVRRTDQNSNRSDADRLSIALYGLVGEIGSLMSAIKKQLLSSEDSAQWNLPTDEIIEELGDIIWYCFSVVQLLFPAGNVNIFNNEIAFLKRMLTEGKYLEFQTLLGPEKVVDFLSAAETFPRTIDQRFDDFQKLAAKTARTEGALLRQVCLSVLWQFGAELLRHKLPESERKINTGIVDRKIGYVLGDIAWCVAVLATVYGLSLDNIVEGNAKKIEFRLVKENPTKLHDEDYPAGQRFPRRFDVSFISVGAHRSRMYLDGRALGDDLTDNSYDNDGYRFHDIMHLSNVAMLGWSPVLRGLLKLKRKGKPKVDEVEDGARAQIVEEAVIKAIHSEGVRLASQRHGGPLHFKSQNIFPSGEDISFAFLKFIANLVSGLEVHNNKYWEWEQAILEGYRIFHELCIHEQGTVSVDLEERTIRFDANVYPDFPGPISGIGTSAAETPLGEHVQLDSSLLIDCVKVAILDSLGLDGRDQLLQEKLEVKMLSESRPSVSARDAVRERMWARSIVCFRTSLLRNAEKITCTALAVADVR